MITNKRIAWITGGGTGIGKELAILLAKKNWLVVISGRRLEKLREVENHDKENIRSVKLDITNISECKLAIEKIVKKFGYIDLAVLNAASYSPGKIDFDAISKINGVIEVNLMGQINCISAILPFMRKKKSGHILVVSSPAGFRGLPNAGPYGITKSALTFLAETLFFELSQYSIKVQVLHPGFVDTPMTKKNKFYMPFIISSKEAAKRIEKKLQSNNFEICFPKKLIIPLKILSLLPYRLYFFFLKKIL